MRRIVIILILPMWRIASVFKSRRVWSKYVIGMLLNFRESIFCSWYQLANAPLKNIIGRIKFKRLGRPTNTAKDTSDFNGMSDKRDNFDLLSTFTYEWICFVNACNKFRTVKRNLLNLIPTSCTNGGTICSMRFLALATTFFLNGALGAKTPW